ncbi:proline--tRNA ligase [candidate division KSB1 bacterium]|nr:MAG: proline--tRNA ligase [candidate division KSB1 bacterium]
MAKNITPRATDYSQWYTDVIREAKLADYAPVKGCMVIRPNGYAIWESIQQHLDRMFKDTGHVNAYFPLLIPQSFLEKEAEHVDGFALECALVTHSGLERVEGETKLRPKGKLEEAYVIRPTSETVIWAMYKNWIQSYRDLPLLINQWANIYRWELRTRLFLRTAEFLWQEGHTAHATAEEAREETLKMLGVYKTFAQDYMAMPVIAGEKTEGQKFPGAVSTYTIEAMMQDRKALQCGTSHFLGQNFAKAFDVTFQNDKNELDYVWATSWGVSTRLIGAIIMTHADDDGMIIPPRLAQWPVYAVPIYRKEDEKSKVIGAMQKVLDDLKRKYDIRSILDDRSTATPGFKFAESELLGYPLRIELGPRDLAADQLIITKRHNREKVTLPLAQAVDHIPRILDEIQMDLYTRACKTLEENTREINSYDELKDFVAADGGFALAHWAGTTEDEKRLQEETKATVRVIPENAPAEKGKCILTGRESNRRVVIAKAY